MARIPQWLPHQSAVHLPSASVPVVGARSQTSTLPGRWTPWHSKLGTHFLLAQETSPGPLASTSYPGTTEKLLEDLQGLRLPFLEHP